MDNIKEERIEWALILKEHRESIEYLVYLDTKLIDEILNRIEKQK